MITVTYCGTEFGGREGMTFGCAGVFPSIGPAIERAESHRARWVRSHDGVGLRPIRTWTHLSGDGDPRKTEVSACGGWGDSLYINYRFERTSEIG